MTKSKYNSFYFPEEKSKEYNESHFTYDHVAVVVCVVNKILWRFALTTLIEKAGGKWEHRRTPFRFRLAFSQQERRSTVPAPRSKTEFLIIDCQQLSKLKSPAIYYKTMSLSLLTQLVTSTSLIKSFLLLKKSDIFCFLNHTSSIFTIYDVSLVLILVLHGPTFSLHSNFL